MHLPPSLSAVTRAAVMNGGSLDAVAQEWLAAGWTAEEARVAASEEFQAEVGAAWGLQKHCPTE